MDQILIKTTKTPIYLTEEPIMAAACRKWTYTSIAIRSDLTVKKQHGGCQNCDYKASKYNTTKIIGRIASKHGRESSSQTTSWNIPLNEQPPAKN